MTDSVDHPPHYTNGPACTHCSASVECITITQDMSFLRGNAMKYLWRADYKGNKLQDLRKAAWYVNREIELLTKDNK
jgi:hypothetical protein